MALACYNMDPEKVKQAIFEEGMETEVVTKIIDIPKVHDYQEPVGNEFFKALSDLETFDIFTMLPIKKLIDFKYPLVKEYTIKKLFVPFVFYLAIFMFYVNVIEQMADTADKAKTFWYIADWTF